MFIHFFPKNSTYMKRYKRSVKKEYKEMLLRTPDIGGSSLEMNL